MGEKKSITYLAKTLGSSIEEVKSTIEELGIVPDGRSHSKYQVPTYSEQTAKELAYHLHNDKIEWYCDNCNDRLDFQSGFSRNCGSWTCTKCGCENEISIEHVDWE